MGYSLGMTDHGFIRVHMGSYGLIWVNMANTQQPQESQPVPLNVQRQLCRMVFA